MLYSFDHQQIDRKLDTTVAALTDEELMGRVQEQDDRAIAVLYERHTPLLRTVIGRILNNDTDVDDLLQEVFLEIWRQAARYSEEKGKALGWIVTLARRRAIVGRYWGADSLSCRASDAIATVESTGHAWPG